MKDESEELRRSFVEAYPVYVVSVLAERGIDVDEVLADAIVEGTNLLDTFLASLGSTPVAEQRSSPLELFREALRPVDRALDVAGVDVAPTGAPTRHAAPWDRYNLAPGSSHVLGDAAHEAHLRWGIAKAARMAEAFGSTAGPIVGILCADGDRPSLVAQAESCGYRTVMLPSPERAQVAVISADEPGADAEVRSASQHGRVIVYGRAIEDLDQMRFASLGAHRTVDAADLLADLARYLPGVV